MKFVVCVIFSLLLAVVSAQTPAPAPVPVPGAPGAPGAAAAAAGDPTALTTYLPDSGVFDNAETDAELVQSLPEVPTCTIRGQTVFEIRKMRNDAKQIGLAVLNEIELMEKRKTYIEEMTEYLNDRIRELNKVKQDMNAERKWIQISNARIAELAQQEKLIKLQDVMSCIRTEAKKLNGNAAESDKIAKNLDVQAKALTTNINAIRTKITQILNTTNT